LKNTVRLYGLVGSVGLIGLVLGLGLGLVSLVPMYVLLWRPLTFTCLLTHTVRGVTASGVSKISRVRVRARCRVRVNVTQWLKCRRDGAIIFSLEYHQLFIYGSRK